MVYGEEFLTDWPSAEAAVDRTRLATLPLRYLDDVAMTVGERDAILGYETPERDPWTLITIQRL